MAAIIFNKDPTANFDRYQLNKEQLGQLRPYLIRYVERFGDKELKSLKDRIVILEKGSKIGFTIQGQERNFELISKVDQIFQRYIWGEIVLVDQAQLRDGMPVIHHRPLESKKHLDDGWMLTFNFQNMNNVDFKKYFEKGIEVNDRNLQEKYDKEQRIKHLAVVALGCLVSFIAYKLSFN